MRPWEKEILFAKSEELGSRARQGVWEVYQRGYERRDLIFLIELLIKGFSTIKGTPFRLEIDNAITSKFGKNGFIGLIYK